MGSGSRRCLRHVRSARADRAAPAISSVTSRAGARHGNAADRHPGAGGACCGGFDGAATRPMGQRHSFLRPV